jgi:hypothetical protein
MREDAAVQQEFLILADGAEAVQGKIYILGGGVTHHVAPTFPAAIRADIALGVLVGWTETNQKIDLKVRVVDEDGSEALRVGAELVVGRPPNANPGQDIRSMMAIRGPLRIPKAGGYRLEMLLDDVVQQPPFRFWVRQAPPSRTRAAT